MAVLSLILILLRIFKSIYLQPHFKTLKDKVVVITGASSGIGEALAHEYYKNNCLVVLCARRTEKLERIKSNLMHSKWYNNSNSPIVMPLDLSDIDSLSRIVEKIISVTGHIDILINNAGITHRGTILDTNIDIHMKVMQVNYFGTVAITNAVLPQMINRKQGHIVFISSVQGLIALPNRSAYGASKHAMQSFSDSLRAEVRKFNISVTTVSPGYTKTDITLKGFTGSGETYGKMEEEIKNGYSTEYVAEKVVQAVVGKSQEVVVAQIIAKIAIMIRKIFPSMYFSIMAHRFEHGYN